MILAHFYSKKGKTCACSLSGHAGYADYGKDIVCASVTSAVQMAANGITEILKVPAQVKVSENEIFIKLPESSKSTAYDFLEALKMHIEILADDYKGTIKVKVSEV